MKQPITLQVPIEDDWDAGTRLQVYSNGGSGAIDTAAPLLPRAKDVFPKALSAAGYGNQVYGVGEYGRNLPDRRANGGYGDQQFGQIDYGDSQPYVEVTCYLPATFGVWKFAVEAIDAEGNVQAGGLEEIERVVSGTEPSPMTDFSLSSYDSETDTFTFAIG